MKIEPIESKDKEKDSFVPLDTTKKEPIDSTEESVGFIPLTDSKQPEDFYKQLDSTVRDIHNFFSIEPYASNAYKDALMALPILDPLTKQQIAKGDASNLKEVYLTPAFHAVNQILFNTPRAVTERMGYSYPEGETLPGQVLAKTAGVAGALAPFSTGANLAGKIGMLAGKGALKTTARGALAGAVQGALYSPEDLGDIGARGRQAALGAALGATASLVTNRVSNFVAKRKLRGKTTLKGRVQTKRAELDYETKLKNMEEDKVLNEGIELLKANQNELQDSVAIQQIQGKVPKTKAVFHAWGKNVSKIYETTVDDISDEIGEIKATEVADYFDGFISDIKANPELANTMAFKRTSSFVKNIGEKKDLTFKQLNALRKSILNKDYIGDIDDVVYTKFRKTFSEYAETIDPSGRFAKLNKEMSPQLEFKWKFLSKTKTYDKYETKGMEGLFKKYASGKNLSLGERELMDDATKYLSKNGINIEDIKSIYSTVETSEKAVTSASKIIETTKESRLAMAAKKTMIRKKQDVKLGYENKAELLNMAKQVAHIAVGIAMTGAIYKLYRAIGRGGDSGATSGYEGNESN